MFQKYKVPKIQEYKTPLHSILLCDRFLLSTYPPFLLILASQWLHLLDLSPKALSASDVWGAEDRLEEFDR